MRALTLADARLPKARGSELCDPSCSCSAQPWRTGGAGRSRAGRVVGHQAAGQPAYRVKPAASLFLNRPLLNPAKLDVTFLPCADTWAAGSEPLRRRRYTLTHNDLTGSLQLSIGAVFNHTQLSNWYLRLLRDEVLAEWEFGSEGSSGTLHVHCHVSGEQFWLASPDLRRFIFEKEMPLVLETIRFGDRALLAARPELEAARVLVHYHSHLPSLRGVQDWGQLGNDASWPVQAPPWALPLQYLASKLRLVSPPPPRPRVPLGGGGNGVADLQAVAVRPLARSGVPGPDAGGGAEGLGLGMPVPAQQRVRDEV